MVLKSQILAGGRGLGTFKSGLKGGVHMTNVEKATELAKQMLGGTLVTKQTGPAGKPVNTLYVAKKMKLVRAPYRDAGTGIVWYRDATRVCTGFIIIISSLVPQVGLGTCIGNRTHETYASTPRCNVWPGEKKKGG